MSSLLSKCEKEKDASETVTPSDLSARDSVRVARIAPKKSRKNSMGEDIFDVDE